jgi:hypothetical protein
MRHAAIRMVWKVSLLDLVGHVDRISTAVPVGAVDVMGRCGARVRVRRRCSWNIGDQMVRAVVGC